MGANCQRCKRTKALREDYPPVLLNDPEGNAANKFPDNSVTTTKYTWYSFLPKNLIEQFRRVTNVYFLVIAIIASVPSVSPVSPVSQWLPLVFVLAVSAIKDLIEDYRRYASDRELNNREYLVYRNGEFTNIKNMDIQVGDMVMVEIDKEVPADIVLLKSSSKDDGLVYVDTANLDGEVNLKQYRALSHTHAMSKKKLAKYQGIVEAEPPSQDLYSLKANVRDIDNDKKISLSAKNMLLRGCRLRNTEHAIGVVVYAGKETKMMLNSNAPPSKFSQMDRTINRVVLVIFLIKVFVVFFCAFGFGIFTQNIHPNPFYMAGLIVDVPVNSVLVFFSYFSIFSYFIPISLIVSLEVAKLFQAVFMMWDSKLTVTVGEDSMGLSVKNSNLNDELARSQYIFSDKTGTLTENKMEFDKASISGIRYDDCREGQLLDILRNGDKESKEYKDVYEYLVTLALCNACVIAKDPETGEIKYQAESPDEVALTLFAKNCEVTLTDRRKDGSVVLDVLGEEVIYQVLATLEFSSDRRRSSVIVRCPDGKLMMYSKGADSVMLARLNKNMADLTKRTVKHVSYFSKKGLRTLAICKKSMSESDYEKFDSAYQEAAASLKNREEQVEEICDRAEREFDLIGATAIEDKLQEGVPEAIDYFIKAGIKFWIITGDKQETAINIAKSCNLIQLGVTIVKVNVTSNEQCGAVLKKAEQVVSSNPRCALVIDGGSLTFALGEHQPALLSVCIKCEAVVCCRATPLQKALIVRMVKRGQKAICLSIGDGANDVSMIQEAHIGVGIFGKEGTQAARSADYSIYMFKHLRRLVCVHGRYNMVRATGLINYSFYKNTAMFIVQLWFAFYNGFSAQTLYDSIVMAVFNVIITFLPPFFFCIFERDVKEYSIDQNPQAYRQIVRGDHSFGIQTLWYWVASMVWHSIVIFFGTYLVFYQNDIIHGHGRNLGFFDIGTTASSVGVLIVLLHAALTTHHWIWLTHLAIWGSTIVYFLLILVLGHMVSFNAPMYYVFETLFSSGAFIFALIFLPIFALLPNFTFLYVRRNYIPKDCHILQEEEKYNSKWGKWG